MKRLIIRWVALAVFLVVLAAVFVRLGEWQLDRLDQKRAANALMEQHRTEPVVDYRSVMGDQIANDDQWQRVTVTGTYDPQQYQVRYRNVDGAPGVEVLAALRTTQGDTVLVDRGFIPREQGKPDPDVLPAPPSGEVEVTGYLRRSERGHRNAIFPNQRRMRLINAEAIAEERGEHVLDGYIQLISSTPDNGSEVTPVPPSTSGEGNHFSYALQWFSFSVIAIVGIVVLVRSDLKDYRKKKARAEIVKHRETDAT